MKPQEDSARLDPGEGGAVAASRHKKTVIAYFERIRPIGQDSRGDVWMTGGLNAVHRAVKFVCRDRLADARPFRVNPEDSLAAEPPMKNSGL